MIDYAYNAETKADRLARHERAAVINSGERGVDGLTAGERRLLDAIRTAGYEIAHVGEWQRYITRRDAA